MAENIQRAVGRTIYLEQNARMQFQAIFLAGDRGHVVYLDDDPTRRQDQLNISQAQAEAVIEPDRMLDDRGPAAEAAIRVRRYRHVHSLSRPGRSCQAGGAPWVSTPPVEVARR